VSLEEVVRLQPDYIVLTSNHADTEMSQVSDLRERPAWMDLQAVEAGHVAVLSEEVARPSPGLIDAIEQLARELHPRIFAPTSAERRPKLEARLLTAPIAGLRKESNQCVR
jgi:ABC-type Fe3+-hydroxamate transport system substrate-binding protein